MIAAALLGDSCYVTADRLSKQFTLKAQSSLLNKVFTSFLFTRRFLPSPSQLLSGALLLGGKQACCEVSGSYSRQAGDVRR
jgi:hypothetical protein